MEADPLPLEVIAFVTSLRGGRFPFWFCGGTKPGRFAVGGAAAGGAGAFAAVCGPMFGRVSGRKDEVVGGLFIGLPMPLPPGAPILRVMSWEGLMKSRVALGPGEAPDSIGFETGRDLVWSTPAVLRIDGLSAWGSKAVADGLCGFSRNRSAVLAEKNPAEGELPGGSISWALRSGLFNPNSRFTGGGPAVVVVGLLNCGLDVCCPGGSTLACSTLCWWTGPTRV